MRPLTGQDDHLAFRVAVAELLQQLDARQAGHLEVQDGHIERPVLRRRQGGFPVRRFLHLKTMTGEHPRHRAAKLVVVIGYQQGDIVPLVHGCHPQIMSAWIEHPARGGADALPTRKRRMVCHMCRTTAQGAPVRTPLQCIRSGNRGQPQGPPFEQTAVFP